MRQNAPKRIFTDAIPGHPGNYGVRLVLLSSTDGTSDVGSDIVTGSAVTDASANYKISFEQAAGNATVLTITSF